jgi:hypothetical protein
MRSREVIERQVNKAPRNESLIQNQMLMIEAFLDARNELVLVSAKMAALVHILKDKLGIDESKFQTEEIFVRAGKFKDLKQKDLRLVAVVDPAADKEDLEEAI